MKSIQEVFLPSIEAEFALWVIKGTEFGHRVISGKLPYCIKLMVQLVIYVWGKFEVIF